MMCKNPRCHKRCYATQDDAYLGAKKFKLDTGRELYPYRHRGVWHCSGCYVSDLVKMRNDIVIRA